MPIDSSIYNNLQPVKIESPLNMLAQVSQVQGAQSRNKLADLAIQQHQIELDKTNALNNAYKGALKPDGSLDQNALFSNIANSGYGSQLPAVQKGLLDVQASKANIGKTTADTAKTQQETAQHQFEIAGQLAGAWAMDPTINKQKIASGISAAAHSGVIPQQIADAKLQELQGLGDDPASLQNWAKGTLSQVMKAKESMGFIAPDANTLATNATSRANNAATNATSRANNQATIAKDYNVAGLNPDGTPGTANNDIVDAIGQYKVAPPNGMALRNPRMQQILAQVTQKYPDFDATQFATRQKANKDFTTGNQGNAMRSFAVAGQHLDQLGQLVDAMDNGNMQIVNKIGNTISQQTGSPAVTNFDAAKDVVSKEVVKAIVAGGGGVAEREELSKLMANVKSPAQLKGVINQYRTLMAAQHDALLQQRRAAGLSDSTLPDYTDANGTAKPASTIPANVQSLLDKYK